MSEEEIRALKELEYDLKEHKTKYAKNYEDVCYNSLIKLQQENAQLKEQRSKAIEIITNDTTLNPQRQRDRLINILESNKED